MTADALDRERAAQGRARPAARHPDRREGQLRDRRHADDRRNDRARGLHAERDAFQVQKLRDAGAVILGKTNMHELAAGITTISSLGGQTRNPYDPSRIPAGRAAAPAPRWPRISPPPAWAATRADRSGFPRRTTISSACAARSGLSSRIGIIPLSHTQDIGGPLARTVTDLAHHARCDGRSRPRRRRPPRRATDTFRRRTAMRCDADALKGARIGVLKTLFGSAPEDDEVAAHRRSRRSTR